MQRLQAACDAKQSQVLSWYVSSYFAINLLAETPHKAALTRRAFVQYVESRSWIRRVMLCPANDETLLPQLLPSLPRNDIIKEGTCSNYIGIHLFILNPETTWY